MPSARVVIAARNEGTLLAATLDALGGTEAGASFETVVVDDGLPTTIAAAPLRARGVGLLRTGGWGAAAARNHGAAGAQTDALCFCDAHMSFAPGWLRALLAGLERFDAVCPGIAAADEPQVCGFGCTWDPGYNAVWLPEPPATQEVPFLPGACLLVRREAFAAVAGFDGGVGASAPAGVELSFALWRCGLRCGAVPGMRVSHRSRARHPYPVFQPPLNRQLLRVGVLHFDPGRLERLAHVLGAGAADVAEARTAAEPRARLLAACAIRPGSSFLEYFGLPV